MEIEKKYLFEEIPGNREDYPCTHIMQAYISRDPVIRIRAAEKTGGPEDGQMKYILTIKGSGLTMREEYELLMTKEQFEGLLPKTTGRIIDKKRYKVPVGNAVDGTPLTAEADYFSGDHEGLKVVEVEFPSEEAMNAFVPPAWFGEDVSGDSRYHNSQLSK